MALLAVVFLANSCYAYSPGFVVRLGNHSRWVADKGKMLGEAAGAVTRF